ncbi:voltage-gated chloride channel family protein [Swingsia samuiensis]|uniref:Voltage-gated chloride channel protein n=1 Tax=Swingsia samuiensis TaxID=1293412 RepID=A0A4Y6UJF3_9PROT|nr:voltage-gated chloride channel family protein [Swingsia samuiensis]QDH16521.1 voltage-gated chloride channel protein [Swingsia samuiensis]
MSSKAKLLSALRIVLLWTALLIPLGLSVGSLCAFFLWALKAVTDYRLSHPSILFALPIAGVGVGLLYYWCGGKAEGGNNLIIDEIHKPGGGVPLRMAPLVLLGTIISHLFGASVGREGTAVQIGGSIAGGIAKLFNLSPQSTRLLLTAGIAAGFGAVFGTPIAGAIFALEVLALGELNYAALLPVAAASIIADWVCHLWGIHHTAYHVGFQGGSAQNGSFFHTNALLFIKVCLASIAFGLVSRCFARSIQFLSSTFKKLCPLPWLRPAIGGLLTILLVEILGTRDYLGLGVTSPLPDHPSIVNFFTLHHYTWSWFFKLIFTVTALSTGFKGGEVTPLFFIGAGLGNALAPLLNVPVDLLAGIGFVSVFAGAANTPLACTFMAVELFGATNIVYYAAGCFIAYITSGHTGIYQSQIIGYPKNIWSNLLAGRTLRDTHNLPPASIHKTTSQHE